jgi:thiamine biosynthesis lipoprotein
MIGAARAPASSTPGAVTAERHMLTEQRRCMGTHCTISAYTDDPAVFDRGVQRALAEIDRLDGLMSTWIPSSDVSRVNAAAGSGEWIGVSADTFAVLEQSLWIAGASEGAFDITVGVFKGLWKFDEDNDGSLPTREAVLARLPLVDYRSLLLDAPGRRARLARKGQSITLGGIAKGYVVDRAVAELRAVGLVDFLVQAGGDLFAAGKRGDRDWKVGIEDPRAPPHDERSTDTSFALLELQDSAFNTSGDYERFVIKDGKRYHHILDPRTGYPVSHTRSVTVLAPTSFLADTLDTAAFVLGVEKGMKLVESVPGAEAVMVDAHNQVHLSPGLQGRIKLLRPPTDAL